MMDSANAKKLLEEIFENLPAHRRKVIDEETTYDDLSERVRHSKIVIKSKSGSEERDVWPIRNRILDMHRMGQAGWPDKLDFQLEVNPKKKPIVTEMGKFIKVNEARFAQLLR